MTDLTFTNQYSPLWPEEIRIVPTCASLPL
jgi:hypothetical protein